MSEKSGPLYPNQPLEEVAAEVRFRGCLQVEQARAEFQKRIKSRYSKLLVPGAVIGVSPAVQHYRLESPDEFGIQLAVNSLGIYARQYPGFDAFFAEASRLIGIAIELIGGIDVTRVGWRYINAIPFPRENGRLPFSKVFQRQPWLASALEGEWESLQFAARMPMKGVTANLRLSAGAGGGEVSELETLVFDIDVFSAFDPVLENARADKCSELIKRMHDAARQVFEDSINEDYRKFLLGANDE